jgi:hypothetical protein
MKSLRTEASLNKLIVASTIVAPSLRAVSPFTLSHSQDPAKDDKPALHQTMPRDQVTDWRASFQNHGIAKTQNMLPSR